MYVQKIINIIDLLKKTHPKMNIGKHIATALDGEDVWSISDKKFYNLLNDYQAKLDAVELLDDNFDLNKIIEVGMSMGK